MKITIPELSLVVLIGASGAGKSSFARRHFKPTETLSSDFCRGLVSDDENSQEASNDAFAVLHFIAARRLAAGKLTVIDATNVEPEARRPLLALARDYHVQPVAIVFSLPEALCHERNRSRPDRNFGPHVVRRQSMQMRRSLRNLRHEGFRHVFELSSPEQVEAVEIECTPLWNNRKHEHGPFDIIGDVHGCFDELLTLLTKLGYEVRREGDGAALRFHVQPPEGRKAIFLGDLVDRGPAIPAVLRLVMDMVEDGSALCIPGNHDMKLLRKLRGRNVQITHGLADSLAQLESEPPTFKERVATFLDGLVSHYVLDDGRLVVAHAGMKETMQGRASRAVREFALYGETTGETDEFGLPVRYNWAAEYRGRALVVYGHTPVPEVQWLNGTINIDTGCVFGGKLTALRYPEKELLSVSAARTYCEPARPFLNPGREDGLPLPPEDAAVSHSENIGTADRQLTAQQQHDDILDIEDVSGKRLVETRLYNKITIREEQAIAALEVMSRFATNPRWLIYLPPTMSPCETASEPGFLEYPTEAFAYYRREGVERVVCEEKHMGSRAVVIVCRDEEAARRRFGVVGEGCGVCYTRTGRRFFEDAALESALLARLRLAMERTGFWEQFQTDWACLDCELMPWSMKAQALLQQQYAAVGAASRAALGEALAALEQARTRGLEVDALLASYSERAQLAARYVDAYRQYCWPVHSLADLKLAPFHLLATEGAVHSDKDHLWHMETLAQICRADAGIGANGDGGPENVDRGSEEQGGGGGKPSSLLLVTPYKVIDVNDETSVAEGVRWWCELTSRGGEGMVVKPLSFVARGAHGLIQPAVKCRGPEYLRIIYGPEYSLPENLERLRRRGLGVKRSLALREFALGIEGLARFVEGEPLRRVHECSFGVLALESEPVDPRL